MSTRYYVFDDRLPAYRDGHEVPMLGFGGTAQKYEPYFDLARWDLAVREISEVEFRELERSFTQPK